MTLPLSHLRRIHTVLAADTDSFTTLAILGGLEPATSFRGADLRLVDFGSDDISGYDFSETDLTEANLSKARGIEWALFHGAKTDGTLWPPGYAPRIDRPKTGEFTCLLRQDSTSAESRVLLRQTFDNERSLSSEWGFPTGNSSFIFPRTQLRPYLPEVSNGRLYLKLDTYNPTAGYPSFLGTGIFTTQTFSPEEGISFEVVARLGQSTSGMIGNIFGLYHYFASNIHSEVSFQLGSDGASGEGQVFTHLLVREPSTAGYIPTARQPIPNLDSRISHRYRIEILPDCLKWFVDGELVRSVNLDAKLVQPVSLHLNFWVPGEDWTEVYDAALQPVTSAAANTSYAFWIEDVKIAALGPKSGDADLNQVELPATLTKSQAPHAVRNGSGQLDLGNIGWQSHLAASHGKTGDEQRVQGNPFAALRSYQIPHDIFDPLTQSESVNARLQSDVTMTRSKIGDLRQTQRPPSVTLKSYQASRDFFGSLRLTRFWDALRRLGRSGSRDPSRKG